MEEFENSHPPKLADRFLSWFCKSELLEEIKGDLHEMYIEETEGWPRWRAYFFYWMQVFHFLRPFAINGQNSKSVFMFFTYLKFARRNLIKHKSSASLNILSLSVGIACFIFIGTYIFSELKYDRFHSDVDRMYRVPIDFVDSKGNRLPDATTPPALAPALKRDFPEVKSVVRIFPGWGRNFRFKTDSQRQFFESKVYRVDSTFFDVFSFSFLHGHPNTALVNPDQMIITRSMAMKYFNDVQVIGEKITLVGEQNKTYRISGVLEDIPEASHMHFDFLIKINETDIDQNWGWYNYYTYIKMNPNVDMASFESKLQPFFESYQDKGEAHYNQIYLQPITSIHLNSNLKWELEPNGNMSSIYIFSILGLFVLLVSSLNFVNLSIAQSVRRYKEVGVRKVFGAQKSGLTDQFIVESLLTTLIALGLGLIISEGAFNLLNPLLDKNLSLFQWDGLQYLLGVCFFIVLVGTISGLFPALHLSSFQVALAVKGLKNKSGVSIKNIRSALLVVQFTLSSLMIIAAIVVQQQLNFMQTKDKGFESDRVLVIENGKEVSNYKTLKNELLKIPRVKSVANASGVLGKLNWTTRVGHPDPFVMNYVAIDEEMIRTLDLQIVQGRSFSKDIISDKEGWTMIVNEKAKTELGLTDEQIGQTIPIAQMEDSIIYGKVIGILKDFQFSNLKMENKPFAFFYREEPYDYIHLKMNDADIGATLSQIESTWSSLSGSAPAKYFFLEQVYEDLLDEEAMLSKLMFGLTVLAFFIAFMGMFSIANMRLKDKLKEIAIRKVLGSSIIDILQLTISKFLKLVLIANLISYPLAYYFAKEWLNGFSYRMSLGIDAFIISLLSTGVIVLIVVGMQTFRVLKGNLIAIMRQE